MIVNNKIAYLNAIGKTINEVNLSHLVCYRLGTGPSFKTWMDAEYKRMEMNLEN